MVGGFGAWMVMSVLRQLPVQQPAELISVQLAGGSRVGLARQVSGMVPDSMVPLVLVIGGRVIGSTVPLVLVIGGKVIGSTVPLVLVIGGRVIGSTVPLVLVIGGRVIGSTVPLVLVIGGRVIGSMVPLVLVIGGRVIGSMVPLVLAYDHLKPFHPVWRVACWFSSWFSTLLSDENKSHICATFVELTLCDHPAYVALMS